jgi:hypothetical protein
MTEKNPNVFDTAGAFNDQHNKNKKPESFVLPLDIAKALPSWARKDFIEQPLGVAYGTLTETLVKPKTWLGTIVAGLGKVINFTSQLGSYGILGGGTSLPDNWGSEFSWKNLKSADYWKTDLAKLKDGWDKAGDITPGRAIQYEVVGKRINQFDNAFSGVASTLTNGKLTGADKWLQNHMAYAANDFDIYSYNQREKAFREQNIGRVSSWATDFMYQWYTDPTILLGKGIKAYKSIGRTTDATTDLKNIISGETTGFKANRIRATFDNFLTKTDGMNQQELLRVKAIRESSNPAALVEILADANKIVDPVERRAAKELAIYSAMGDVDSFVKLTKQSERLATKIGSLHDEVNYAKYLGKSVDPKSKRLTFELLNEGDNLSKIEAQLADYEERLADVHRHLSETATLDPTKVPFYDMGAATRSAFVNSEKILELRNGILAGPTVRVMTGFFTKTPKFWLDFTDNGSVQTIDNMLNRVVGLSGNRAKEYTARIATLSEEIASKKLKGTELKDAKLSLENLTNEFNTAHFTPARRNELLAKYTRAANDQERALAYQEIEVELFDTIALQFGYSKDEVAEAYRLFSNGRTRARNMIKERAYTGATQTVKSGGRSIQAPVGARITGIEGTGGLIHVFPMPLNETQLMKALPSLDIDAMYLALRRHSRVNRIDSKYGKPASNAYVLGSKVQRGTVNFIDALDSLLKFEVLARLGYPIRNATEGNGRILATVGPLALWEANSKYTKNFMTNRFGKSTAKEILTVAERTRIETERMALYAGRDLADDPIAVDALIVELDQILAGKISSKSKFGVGTYQHNGVTLNDAKGATIEQSKYYDEKFIREGASVLEGTLGFSNKSLSNALQTNGDFAVVKGTQENWADAYVRVVNRQIRQSQLSSQFLNSKTKVKDVEKWLTSTTEGKQIMRTVAQGRSAAEMAQANADNVNHLFDASPSLRKIAQERAITADDITVHLGVDTRLYPDVNGAMISETNGTSPFMRMQAGILEKFYKYLGEAPESHLTRSPLFVDLYRTRLNASVDHAIATFKGDTIPASYLNKLESSARQFARQEMRRTLYDISERSSNATTLRYLFPFFGAFSDVAEKWSRIVLNDPSVAPKAAILWNSPDRAGLTEERDGLTYINVPGEWTKNIPGLNGRELSIPKASLNLVFQGQHWWAPGAGWFVQFGVSQLVKQNTELENLKIVKEILPYGVRQGNLAQSLQDLVIQSPAARRAIGALDANDPNYQRLVAIIYAEEMVNFNKGLRDARPDKSEINNKARMVLGLEVASRLVLPFATNYKSPYQFYIDEYQAMRQEDPLGAAEKFYDKYGDTYFEMTTSISKNNTGVASSQSAYKRSKELADLIAKQPDYGWFLVGDANSGEFSPVVYGNQFTEATGPGSTVNYRERQDPYAAVEEAQSEKGWLIYRQGMALLESARIKSGFDSFNSAGAEFLLERKRNFIADLGEMNPAWQKNYKSIDSGKVANFLRFATSVVDDPRLSGRQDIQTLKLYMQGREWLRNQLKFRPSANIENVSNSDLKANWDRFTGQLMDQDITFERIYTRMLEKDNPSEGF